MENVEDNNEPCAKKLKLDGTDFEKKDYNFQNVEYEEPISIDRDNNHQLEITAKIYELTSFAEIELEQKYISCDSGVGDSSFEDTIKEKASFDQDQKPFNCIGTTTPRYTFQGPSPVKEDKIVLENEMTIEEKIKEKLSSQSNSEKSLVGELPTVSNFKNDETKEGSQQNKVKIIKETNEKISIEESSKTDFQVSANLKSDEITLNHKQNIEEGKKRAEELSLETAIEEKITEQLSSNSNSEKSFVDELPTISKFTDDENKEGQQNKVKIMKETNDEKISIQDSSKTDFLVSANLKSDQITLNHKQNIEEGKKTAEELSLETAIEEKIKEQLSSQSNSEKTLVDELPTISNFTDDENKEDGQQNKVKIMKETNDENISIQEFSKTDFLVSVDLKFDKITLDHKQNIEESKERAEELSLNKTHQSETKLSSLTEEPIKTENFVPEVNERQNQNDEKTTVETTTQDKVLKCTEEGNANDALSDTGKDATKPNITAVIDEQKIPQQASTSLSAATTTSQAESVSTDDYLTKSVLNPAIIRPALDHSMASDWTSPSHKPLALNHVNINTVEFNKVKNLFAATARGMTITKLERVENPYLLAMYLLKKEKMERKNFSVDERSLFHGTREINIKSICTYNFDWRRRGQSRGHKFGQGVSFSPQVSYADHYNFSERVMILTKVLVGKVTRGDYHTLIPEERYDSTQNHDGNVIVKYEDDDFYPQYCKYCKAPPRYISDSDDDDIL